MNEQDFYKKLEEINTNIEKIQKSLKISIWKIFFEGILRGFGYMLGVIIAIAILGWILNIIGVIPAFTEEVNTWQSILDKATNK